MQTVEQDGFSSVDRTRRIGMHYILVILRKDFGLYLVCFFHLHLLQLELLWADS